MKHAIKKENCGCRSDKSCLILCENQKQMTEDITTLIKAAGIYDGGKLVVGFKDHQISSQCEYLHIAAL